MEPAAEAVVDAGGEAAEAVVDAAEPAVEVLSVRWHAFAEYIRLDRYTETISTLTSIAVGWTAMIVLLYCCLTKLLLKEKTQKEEHSVAREDVEGGRGRGGRTEGLPAGWEAFEDDISGATYYYNAYTEQTTWEEPGFEGASTLAGGGDAPFLQGEEAVEEEAPAASGAEEAAAASESTQLLSGSLERSHERASEAAASSVPSCSGTSSLLVGTPSRQMRESVELSACSPVGVTPSSAASSCSSPSALPSLTPPSALLQTPPSSSVAMMPSPVEAEASTSPNTFADPPAPSSVFNFFGTLFQGISLETHKSKLAIATTPANNNSSRNSDRGSSRRPGSWRRGNNANAAQAAAAHMAGAQAVASTSAAPSSSPPRSRATKLTLPPVPLTKLPERFPADRNALNSNGGGGGAAGESDGGGSDSWRSSIFGRSGISSGIIALTDRLVESTPTASRRSYRKLVPGGEDDPSGGASSYRSPGPGTFSDRRKMFELGQLELERQEREELDRIGWTPPPPKLLPRAGLPGEEGDDNYAA